MLLLVRYTRIQSFLLEANQEPNGLHPRKELISRLLHQEHCSRCELLRLGNRAKPFVLPVLPLAQVEELHGLMKEGLASGEVRPLPLTAFPREKAEDAFRFLASGIILHLLEARPCIYGLMLRNWFQRHA